MSLHKVKSMFEICVYIRAVFILWNLQCSLILLKAKIVVYVVFSLFLFNLHVSRLIPQMYCALSLCFSCDNTRDKLPELSSFSF